jgi:UDP-N-acetylmuramate--alanine ligase
LDEIILLGIYPARELPIPGITSKVIFDLMKNPNKVMLGKDEILPYLGKREIDVLLTLGAGDIGMMPEKIKNLLQQK